MESRLQPVTCSYLKIARNIGYRRLAVMKLIVDSCVTASGNADRPVFQPTIEVHALGFKSRTRSNCGAAASDGAKGFM